MSRFKRAFHNALSSWLALGVATCYTLASVPLALHYLSKERFALWALMSSISGYLNLIDLGMSGSVARLLIDHKDDRTRSNYGSLIQTGWLVLAVQGLILLVVCFGLAPVLAVLLDIPADLKSEFIALMRWQGVTLAVNFMTRIFSHILYAHQRGDLNNYAQSGSVVVSIVSLWYLFHSGHGVFSLVWSGLLATSITALWLSITCWKLHHFPLRGCWGRPSWPYFRELFLFGKDLFLIALGSQLIQASQTLIITRCLGLGLAAVWAIGTKAYSLVLQLIWRTSDASMPGFGEMISRREEAALLTRYRMVATLSASFSAFCAIGYVLCNSSFVTLWTGGKITWQPINDILLGSCLVVTTVAHVHTGFIGMTKQLHFLRYIFFVEGIVFVATAIIVAHHGQIYPIILCSLVCSILFTGLYTTFRVWRFFHLSIRQVAWDWLSPMRSFLLRAVPVAVLAWWATRTMLPLPRFLLHAGLSSTLVLWLLTRYGVSRSFQEELLIRSPKPTRRVLRWLLPSTARVPASANVPG
jgi:O-antigen/teichoic acid export membrane protein